MRQRSGPKSVSDIDQRTTAGPWEWGGNNHGLSLFTQHSGRVIVLGFGRFGLQGAQPTFPVGYKMVKVGVSTIEQAG